jgi:4-diphosphocytidyl-2-C-methyl-D-erythritol kinase
MICFPNAKINIGLNIIEKRADGFHNIESVMVPLKGILCDALEITSSPTLLPREKGVTAKLITSGIMIPGNAEDNLCIKAYQLIKKDYPQVPPIEIHLLKAIPIGAGLGGGSADAAFFIRLLNDTFELGISWGEMHHYARQLGSDCSFFVSNKPAFAEEKGDKFESINLDLSGYHIAVVYPDIHINTAKAYSDLDKAEGRRQKANGRLEDLIQLPIQKWKKTIRNDFEDSVFPKYPEIKKIKEKLYSLGAIYASMSGSGSAVYGIFKKEPKVNLPAGKAGKKFGDYQVWEGIFN